METHLRPLNLGEILDRTAELYRSNFLLLAGISSIYAGALLVLSLIQIGVQQGLRFLHMTGARIPAMIVGIVVLWLVVFVAGGVAVAANTRAVGWLHLGEPASIGLAYRAILPRTGRYLWLMTITYFRAWFPSVLLYAAYFALILTYVRQKGMLAPHPGQHVDPQALLIFGLASIAFFLLLMLAVVYGILMSLRYALAVPACTVENLKARDAIRRSIQLSKGTRGRIFLLFLLTLVIEFGLFGVTQGFFIVIGIKHHGVVPVWMSILQQVLAFFTNTFVGPIYATGFTLFYYDQRVRKEGFDIERLMQTAGMVEPPPAVEMSSLTSVETGAVHE
jgi:Membrane domain of glycerophosphoryl diester phosphodiesterase